jgi:protein-tyrosine phosphatase
MLMNSTDPHIAARTIDLRGTSNTRDIGGYATRDGHVTRFGRVLRSDALHALTGDDQAILAAHDIGTTIDLRFTSETMRSPSVYQDSTVVRYLHLPLHEPYGDANLHTITATLGRYYTHLVDTYPGAVLSVFEALTEPQALPAIVHCTVGKDRTGVIVGLLLSALGVDDETVIADYALTGVVASDLIVRLRAEAIASGMPVEWCERMFGSEPDNMRALLAHLQQTHGGARDYLRAIGLSDTRFERLRANVLA